MILRCKGSWLFGRRAGHQAELLGRERLTEHIECGFVSPAFPGTVVSRGRGEFLVPQFLAITEHRFGLVRRELQLLLERVIAQVWQESTDQGLER